MPSSLSEVFSKYLSYLTLLFIPKNVCLMQSLVTLHDFSSADSLTDSIKDTHQ